MLHGKAMGFGHPTLGSQGFLTDLRIIPSSLPVTDSEMAHSDQWAIRWSPGYKWGSFACLWETAPQWHGFSFSFSHCHVWTNHSHLAFCVTLKLPLKIKNQRDGNNLGLWWHRRAARASSTSRLVVMWGNTFSYCLNQFFLTFTVY